MSSLPLLLHFITAVPVFAHVAMQAVTTGSIPIAATNLWNPDVVGGSTAGPCGGNQGWSATRALAVTAGQCMTVQISYVANHNGKNFQLAIACGAPATQSLLKLSTTNKLTSLPDLQPVSGAKGQKVLLTFNVPQPMAGADGEKCTVSAQDQTNSWGGCVDLTITASTNPPVVCPSPPTPYAPAPSAARPAPGPSSNASNNGGGSQNTPGGAAPLSGVKFGDDAGLLVGLAVPFMLLGVLFAMLFGYYYYRKFFAMEDPDKVMLPNALKEQASWVNMMQQNAEPGKKVQMVPGQFITKDDKQKKIHDDGQIDVKVLSGAAKKKDGNGHHAASTMPKVVKGKQTGGKYNSDGRSKIARESE